MPPGINQYAIRTQNALFGPKQYHTARKKFTTLPIQLQKLNNPLLLFPKGYTTNALKNNPTVIPIAT